MRIVWYNVIKGGDNMAESKLRDLSMDFSVEILRICDGIKGILQSWISWNARQHQSVQTFTRQIMRRAKRILLPSCKSHWKSATKPNTGWSCSWSQIFLTVILQRKYTPTAARFAGFSFLLSTPQRTIRNKNAKRRFRPCARNRTGGVDFPICFLI